MAVFRRLRFSLRWMMLLVTAASVLAAVWADRERERLTLIERVEQRGGAVDVADSLIPGLTGRVTGVTIPYAVYEAVDFPALSRFKHLEELRLTDFESAPTDTRLTATEVCFTNQQTIRRIADRRLEQDSQRLD